ncbi:hypothetical protein P5673_033093 [Acropora cervicornis]|uniref:Exonuclease domain-containing protein n=1 Tax=Acropora cervicornis TaxID=6130 RepID=A0AAD9URG6_ACRCE|nr:hypothetical protein P5673_033093 [Acropora cervicornis]
MGIDGDHAAQEIPAPPADSKNETVSLSKDYHHIIFDLETSGRALSCNITRSITFQRGMLSDDGQPITDAIATDVALKHFIEWLNSRMPCILVAHNCKSFDARFLVQAAEKNGVIFDLAQTVSGFTDSLPSFRELLPERKSHSQEKLVQDLLSKSNEAYNALADVQTLYQLVNKFLNVKLLLSWVAYYQRLLKEKKFLVNTLQPLLREKYMSASMAIKCANSGLRLHHLQLVYQRGKKEGVKQVLMDVKLVFTLLVLVWLQRRMHTVILKGSVLILYQMPFCGTND